MTQFNSPTYDIERPTGQCAFTGKPLTPGDAYMAVLVEVDPGVDEKGKPINVSGLKRLDVSIEAWQQAGRPERMFSFWKSVVPQPNQKKKLFVNDEVLTDLFVRLSGTDQPQRVAFRFVLALILMRKKLLRYEGSKRGDASGGTAAQEVWLMTPKGQDTPLGVLNPRLEDEQIRQVTEQLGEILEAEL